MSAADEDDLPVFAEAVQTARDYGHKVLLVASDLGPIQLHQLLALGADGFVP